MRYVFPSRARALFCAILLLLVVPGLSHAQQMADPDFKPKVEQPAYASGKGPLVLIDEAHHNFHTVDGRYKPFADFLRLDGFRVKGSRAAFTRDALKDAKVLVIANALSEKNLNKPVLPIAPAFTAEEVSAVKAWVNEGGSLLLIADHMPWPGAAAELASAFGFLFGNGFAFSKEGSAVLRFARKDGSLMDHPVTRGSAANEKVAHVMTFAGQAFRARRGVDAKPLMVFGDDTLLLMPTQAWKFSPQTPRLSASGMYQGAVLQHGSGRVAVFGEAAMFSAQLTKDKKQIGMNHPGATHNARLLLNVMRWLSGKL